MCKLFEHVLYHVLGGIYSNGAIGLGSVTDFGER